MAECQNVSNFCVRKRLGLGVGLGMGGETTGRLVLLPEKKDKVRVRGRVRVARRHIGRYE